VERILIEPGGELRSNLAKILGAAALGQHDEMLMAIEFPDDLVITSVRGIKVGNLAEVFEASLPSREIIPAPRDVGSRGDIETEDRKIVTEDALG
jgi:hypothetical protein